MKKTLTVFSLLFLLSACAPVTIRRVDFVPTFTPVLDRGIAPQTPTPNEKVVTLLPEPTRTVTPAPDTSATPVDMDLTPILLEGFDVLAIPARTYIDSHAGFALDYPEAWQLTAPGETGNAAAYTASIISYAGVTPGPKQQEGIPAGHTKIEIVVFQDQTYTYEEAVDSQRRQNEAEMPTKLLMDEGWRLPSGLPARRWVVDGMAGQVNILITAIDGRKIIVAGYGEAGLFNVIAGSIRPTE